MGPLVLGGLVDFTGSLYPFPYFIFFPLRCSDVLGQNPTGILYLVDLVFGTVNIMVESFKFKP